MNIVANGIRINYELAGKGRCLTLIHGARENTGVWYNQVPVFSHHYQVLTHDVRGHGQTELGEGEPTLELCVADLYNLLQTLGILNTILLGFSMGGSIALEFALTHSRLVSALILSNSTGGVRRSEEVTPQVEASRWAEQELATREGMEAVLERRASRFFSPGFALKNRETVERYRAILMRNGPQGYLRERGRIGKPRPLEELKNIACPTLILAGKHDSLSSFTTARLVHEMIPRFKLVVFATGHASHLEQPEAYNKAVLDFLSEVGLG